MVGMKQNPHTVQKLLNRISSARVLCRHCFVQFQIVYGKMCEICLSSVNQPRAEAGVCG